MLSWERVNCKNDPAPCSKQRSGWCRALPAVAPRSWFSCLSGRDDQCTPSPRFALLKRAERFFKTIISPWKINLTWAGKESEQADKRKETLSYSKRKRKQVSFNLHNEWRRLTLHLIKVWKDRYSCQVSLNLLASPESILEWIPGIRALHFSNLLFYWASSKKTKPSQIFFSY